MLWRCFRFERDKAQASRRKRQIEEQEALFRERLNMGGSKKQRSGGVSTRDGAGGAVKAFAITVKEPGDKLDEHEEMARRANKQTRLDEFVESKEHFHKPQAPCNSETKPQFKRQGTLLGFVRHQVD